MLVKVQRAPAGICTHPRRFVRQRSSFRSPLHSGFLVETCLAGVFIVFLRAIPALHSRPQAISERFLKQCILRASYQLCRVLHAVQLDLSEDCQREVDPTLLYMQKESK
jgi:hypothetical protein